MKILINNIIDYFYRPIFARHIGLQTFRYGLCGGVNMLLDIVLYFIIFQFVIQKQNLNLDIVVISPQIAAFLITFPITFYTGLWLSKNITFSDSIVKGSVQSFRYFLVVLCNIAIKYFGIKLLVDVMMIFPSVSNSIMTVVTVIFSYVAQRKFSFKV